MPSAHDPVAARPATRDDLPAIADTLAEAFTDYPWTRWALPAEGYQDRLRAVQRYFVEKVGLAYGRVWTAMDGAAVSAWSTPDTSVPPEVFTSPELTELYGDRGTMAAKVEEALMPHRPTGPCWFLATVGVRRGAQGRGLGSAVIAPGLRAADENGSPAFLETADERNVRLYRRFGFEVTSDVLPPEGAPRTWGMLREPRSNGHGST